MRSVQALVGAISILATLPMALLANALLGEAAASPAVHFSVGLGAILLATGAFDFGLPRWVAVVGAASAGAFGGIFVLQGINDIVQVESLRWLAFDVLGGPLERLLPYGIMAWFAGLLLSGSAGRSRFLGWAIVPLVVGLEVAQIVGVAVGIEVPFVKAAYILPFIWLLFEAAEPGSAGMEPVRRSVRAPVDATA